nr:hypothetical protein [Haliscomenobacter sp.]
MDRIRKSFRLFLLFVVIFVLGAFTGQFFTDKITEADVRGAAKIFGLEMSQSEIDSLLPGLEDARTAYLAHRKMTPSNDLGPALWFNPVLPGMNVSLPKIVMT